MKARIRLHFKSPWNRKACEIFAPTFFKNFTCIFLADEKLNLGELYDSTNGPGWIRSTHWRSSSAVKLWFGATVDDSNHLSELLLDENNLSGKELKVKMTNLEKIHQRRLISCFCYFISSSRVHEDLFLHFLCRL